MSSEQIPQPNHALRVVIAGGGVAGLEAALTLRELARDRVQITMLEPKAEFVNRPMVVGEPFARPMARRYSLESIAADLDVTLIHERFGWLDYAHRLVHTEAGAVVPFDALLLAVGAEPRAPLHNALTLDVDHLDEQLRGLILDIEAGYLRSVVFVVPGINSWPLPIYELALMTAVRADSMNVELSVTVVTYEDAPLAIFGTTASDAVSELLARERVDVVCSAAHCAVRTPGCLSLEPGNRQITADRMVTLPTLHAPQLRGVPADTASGFVQVDPFGRVQGLDRVYAAGDVTDFAIKHGGLAAQQAEAAAASIAALAGAAVTPHPLRPILSGVLLSGNLPLRLSAHVTGKLGSASRVAEEHTRTPKAKILAPRLTPYLERQDRALTT